MKTKKKSIREAAQQLLAKLEAYGDWEDGCFYYKKISASELEQPIRDLIQALEHVVEEKP